MSKQLMLLCAIALFVAPAFAFAADDVQGSQLITLYSQLVSLLRQEITIMQDPTQTYLSIYPTSGVVPLFATFIVHHPTGTEGINFGDGHTTGSNGCSRNAQGWCDLSQPVAHKYLFPDNYSVSLFKHLSPDQTWILSTSTITVSAATTTRYNPNQ